MSKSSKKTNVEVAPAVPVVTAKPVKKDKRDAEAALEKEVSAKRQKKDIEKVVPNEDTKNLKKALKNVPPKKKPETSSSEDDFSSDSEDDFSSDSEDDFSSDSEEEEPAKTIRASGKKVSVAAKNGSAAAVTKKGKESSSSKSVSDEDEKAAKAVPESKRIANSKNDTPAASKKDESSDISDSDSDSDDSDEEVAPKAAKVIPAAKKQATTVTNAKRNDESSDSSESDTDTDDDEDTPKAASAAKKQATTVINLKKSNDSSKTDSDETDDDSDESDDEPQPKKSKVTDSLPSKISNVNAKANAKNVKESDSSDEDEPSNTQNVKMSNTEQRALSHLLTRLIKGSSKTKAQLKELAKPTSGTFATVELEAAMATIDSLKTEHEKVEKARAEAQKNSDWWCGKAELEAAMQAKLKEEMAKVELAHQVSVDQAQQASAELVIVQQELAGKKIDIEALTIEQRQLELSLIAAKEREAKLQEELEAARATSQMARMASETALEALFKYKENEAARKAEYKREFLASQEFYDLLGRRTSKILYHGFKGAMNQIIQSGLIKKETDLSFLSPHKLLDDLPDSTLDDAPPSST